MKAYYIVGNPETMSWAVEIVNQIPDGILIGKIYLADRPYKFGVYFPKSRDSFPDDDDIWLFLRKAMWTMRTSIKPQHYWLDELGKVKI